MVLDLSDNKLSIDTNNVNSSTHELPRLKELRLRSCNLSANRIVGEIPNWIWGTKLQRLNLCLNLLTHLQKPYHIPTSLAFLTLFSNQFRGEILPNIENQTSELISISLANIRFIGSVPTSKFLNCLSINWVALYPHAYSKTNISKQSLLPETTSAVISQINSLFIVA